MKHLMIALLTLMMLGGCTMYNVKKEVDPTTGIMETEVSIKTTRDLEQPEVHYTRTGKDATFDFQAASVDNNTDAFMGMFQGMMGMMMQMMQQMMGMPTPTINAGDAQ